MSSLIQNILASLAAAIVLGALGWGAKRAIGRIRRWWTKGHPGMVRDTLRELWRASQLLPAATADFIEHGDPVWFGPDNTWQTSDSMRRSANLGTPTRALATYAANARTLGWTVIADRAEELHDACWPVWSAWETKRQNTDEDTAKVKASAHALAKELSRSRYRRAIRRETATGLWTAANAAPVRVGDIVRHGDPHLNGPGKGQASGTMARGVELNLLLEVLDRHTAGAEVLGWTTLGSAARELRTACAVVMEAWGGTRVNSEADTAAVAALAGGIKRQLSRPRFRFYVRRDADVPVELTPRWDD